MNAMASVTEDGFRFCRSEVRRTAKHFSYGFRLLPVARRRAIESLYAFARHVDDIADEPGPDTAERLRRLDQTKLDLQNQVFGPKKSVSPLMAALSHTVESYKLEPQPFFDLIEGMAWDATGRDYHTLEEMEAYCYRAASTVGLLSLPVFGISDRQASKAPGISLGLFMQTVNILRDVGEDLQRERVYLPSDLLKKYGLSADDLRCLANQNGSATIRRKQAFTEMGQCLTLRARKHLHDGQALMPMLEPMGRMCVRVMSGLYEDILDLMERNRFDVFSTRPKLSREKKWRRLLMVCLDPRTS